MSELPPIIKCLPLSCPQCKSKCVIKAKNGSIECDDCSTVTTKKGEKKSLNKTDKVTGKGHNPKFDLGDYLE